MRIILGTNVLLGIHPHTLRHTHTYTHIETHTLISTHTFTLILPHAHTALNISIRISQCNITTGV